VICCSGVNPIAVDGCGEVLQEGGDSPVGTVLDVG